MPRDTGWYRKRDISRCSVIATSFDDRPAGRAPWHQEVREGRPLGDILPYRPAGGFRCNPNPPLWFTSASSTVTP